jgi:hypothetical protein
MTDDNRELAVYLAYLALLATALTLILTGHGGWVIGLGIIVWAIT